MSSSGHRNLCRETTLRCFLPTAALILLDIYWTPVVPKSLTF